jgi:TrmH family RNA methyltransferase
MSESNSSPRKVQVKLDRKFGVVEDDMDHPVRSRPNEEEVAEEKKSAAKVPYGGWSARPEEERPVKVPGATSPWDRARTQIPAAAPVRPSRDSHEEKPRDRNDHRPGKKGQFDSLLTVQKDALANPETAAAMQAELDPPWIKRILALTTDKGREKEEKFLAEGVRCALEMVQYHAELVDGVYTVEGFDDKRLLDMVAEKNLRLSTLSAAQMERISTTVTSQGVVVVCRSASTKPDYALGPTLTLADGVQDPGNLGAIFRTSLGFGMGVLLGKGSVNPFNPKVVRGSSGTFLRVPFEQDVDLLERIQFLRHKGYTIIATDLHAKQSLADISPRKLRKVAILVGNEGAGADIRHISHADEVVRIPMEKTLESLNVSVAHGILCFQIAQIREAQK